MVEVLTHELEDHHLVAAARGGDQEAFAELYQRYFDPVYDFVARMTRNRDEAADIAQDTFLKAMNALGGLKEGASFKSWIFTIARNTALNRIERVSRTRPLAFEDDEGEEVSFQVIDSDRFANPEQAAEANAVASLVWEAAATLDPKQLSLLDLHLRQGLDSAEIADVLGVTKNNGYVMLNRLKKAVEEAIGAFVMLHHGRRYCDELDAALAEARIESPSPDVRKLVSRHISECSGCEERKRRMVAPLAVFGAFAPVASPPMLKAEVLGKIMSEWSPAPASPLSAQASYPPNPILPVGAGRLGRVLAALAGFGGAALILGVALFWPGSPIALVNGDDPFVVLPVIDPTETATPTAALEPSPTPEPATTVPSSATTETPTPPPSSTPPPPTTPAVTTPPGPTATPSPATTGTPSATPTRTPTPVPTPTPRPTPTATVCTPSLSSSAGGTVNMGNGTTQSFVIFNGSFCGSVDIAIEVEPGAPWLTVAPATATIPAGGQVSVLLTADRSQLQPGKSFATVTVSVPGSSVSLQVSVQVDGPAPPPDPSPTPTATPSDTAPPVVSAASAVCDTRSIAVRASVSDQTGVAAVVLDNGISQQPLELVGGTAQSGDWAKTAIYNSTAEYWRLILTDTLGHPAYWDLRPAGCP